MQTKDWAEIRNEAWWATRGLARPRAPAAAPLRALARDALSGESLVATGLPATASAASFLEHVLAWWDSTHRSSPLDSPDAEPAAEDASNPAAQTRAKAGQVDSRAAEESCTDKVWPRWAATAALGSPLGAIALHAAKLESPLAIAHLWAALVDTLAVEHCETGTPALGAHGGVDAESLRQGSVATGDAVSQSTAVLDEASVQGDSDKVGAKSGLGEAADATKDKTLRFEPPHFCVVLGQLNACLAELARRDDAAAAAVDTHGLGTIQEGEGEEATGSGDEAGEAKQRGEEDVQIGAAAGASDVHAEGTAMEHSGADQGVSARVSAETSQGKAAGEADEAQGHDAHMSPDAKFAATDGTPPEGTARSSAEASPAEEARAATNAQGSDWSQASIEVLEANARGAVEALRDADPAHVLAALLLTFCQVCNHLFCSKVWVPLTAHDALHKQCVPGHHVRRLKQS